MPAARQKSSSRLRRTICLLAKGLRLRPRPALQSKGPEVRRPKSARMPYLHSHALTPPAYRRALDVARCYRLFGGGISAWNYSIFSLFEGTYGANQGKKLLPV